MLCGYTPPRSDNYKVAQGDGLQRWVEKAGTSSGASLAVAGPVFVAEYHFPLLLKEKQPCNPGPDTCFG